MGPRRRHRRTAPPTAHPARCRHHRRTPTRRHRSRTPLPTTPPRHHPTDPRITTAVDTARQRLDTARSALLGTAGGAEGIVTDRHIHTLRAPAIHADTQALTAARRHARDLDNQLARAEHLAARSFAENPAYTYDLAAELPQLRGEIDYLAAASAASPAALYHPPATALTGLDEPHRHTVTALASSIHTVQPSTSTPAPTKPACSAHSLPPHTTTTTAYWPYPPAPPPSTTPPPTATPIPP